MGGATTMPSMHDPKGHLGASERSGVEITEVNSAPVGEEPIRANGSTQVDCSGSRARPRIAPRVDSELIYRPVFLSVVSLFTMAYKLLLNVLPRMRNSELT
jgi:hypothetical protein